MEQYNMKTAQDPSAEDIAVSIAMIPADFDRGVPDEADYGTSCYLCYAQCINFGNHGASVRPCSKGFADLIEYRRNLRRSARND